MPHDASKVLLGSVGSSAKEISDHDSDPASFPAGVKVTLASTGALSLLKSAGQPIGISIGKSLSDHKKTAVARTGSQVPVLVQGEDPEFCVVGAKVYFDDDTGLACDPDDEELDSTISDATYVSGLLTGVLEDGTTANVALVDITGGL